MSKRVLACVFDGFEELELVAPVDILRRAGIEVVIAKLAPGLERENKTAFTSNSISELSAKHNDTPYAVRGRNGIVLLADRLVSELKSEITDLKFDMIFLPGGPGVDAYKQDKTLHALLHQFNDSGRWLAAICAAPTVLAHAGLLKTKTVTSFPATENEMRPLVGSYSEGRVLVDGKILTSRGAGCAEEFAYQLVETLLDKSAADRQKKAIVSRFE